MKQEATGIRQRNFFNKVSVIHAVYTFIARNNQQVLEKMKTLLILLSISFALSETIWDEFSSEESSESKEDDVGLEIDLENIIGQNAGEKKSDQNSALNKCLTIKNPEKISSCVVQLCAKNCQAIHQKSEGVNYKTSFSDEIFFWFFRNV